MKKFILAISFFLLISFISSWSIFDYSATGWNSSTGLNTMPGEARDVVKIGNSYHFWCHPGFVCYDIQDEFLIIYNAYGPPDEDDVDVTISPN